MRALDRKLLRDLWNVRSQVLAIALVVSSGIALLVMSQGVFGSLLTTRDAYYNRYAFADVFAGAKRVPNWVEERIAAIPGVRQVQTRVVVSVSLDVPGVSDPVNGRLISLPDRGRPALNDVALRRGRLLDPDRAEEALVGERFAEAHGLDLGDRLFAIINGRRQPLLIVGVALSPEYVYGIGPGEIVPDPKHFGFLWMSRRPLATAFEMEGGFNDVALTLADGSSSLERAVIVELDALLDPYGGLGAIPRSEQTSNWYLQNELSQLQNMGLLVPLIFLAVATFLLNVVLRRTVAVQREQIAALKALGYSNIRLGVHYVQWAVAVVAIGALLGIGAGLLLAEAMLGLYMDYFRFPLLIYKVSASSILIAVGVSLVAAAVGALGAVRSVVVLPPAEAMRPATPETFRVSLFERLGAKRWLSQPARMVLRNLSRRPMRAGLSIVGIAFAGAIMVAGWAMMDSMDELLEVQFNIIQRQDLSVSFFEPVERSAVHELAALPGVLQVEPTGAVAARLRNGHLQEQTAIQALAPGARLRRVVDVDYRAIQLDRPGLVLSTLLADKLQVEPGDMLLVEVMEAARPVRDVVLTDTVDDLLGVTAYMEQESLQRLVRRDETVNGAMLKIDSLAEERLYGRLKAMPAVAGVSLRRAALENIQTYMLDNMGMMMSVNLVFAVIIAFGVIYNTARISLSETSRELASLRVIGFTRAEISSILLGELGILTLVSIPLGLFIGYGMITGVMSVFESELFRLPVVIEPSTFLVSAAAVLGSMAISAWTVRRKLHDLDLVAVLKTRE